MPILHLGVADVPYSAPPQYGSAAWARRQPKIGKGGTKRQNIEGTESTGDVAERLEDKYHIMQIFYEQHKKDIALALEGSLAGALENLLMGSPSSVAPLSEGAAQIETIFKKFLTDKEMDSLGYPGIPTKASLLGISHRFKGKHGPPRPSFIDTGLYETSFKAWGD